MKINEVINHTRDFDRSFIKHSATVKISGELNSDRDLAVEASIAVGYHPGGYGLYSYSVKDIGANTFNVCWKTLSSCD